METLLFIWYQFFFNFVGKPVGDQQISMFDKVQIFYRLVKNELNGLFYKLWLTVVSLAFIPRYSVICFYISCIKCQIFHFFSPHICGYRNHAKSVAKVTWPQSQSRETLQTGEKSSCKFVQKYMIFIRLWHFTLSQSVKVENHIHKKQTTRKWKFTMKQTWKGMS